MMAARLASPRIPAGGVVVVAGSSATGSFCALRDTRTRAALSFAAWITARIHQDPQDTPEPRRNR